MQKLIDFVETMALDTASTIMPGISQKQLEMMLKNLRKNTLLNQNVNAIEGIVLHEINKLLNTQIKKQHMN